MTKSKGRGVTISFSTETPLTQGRAGYEALEFKEIESLRDCNCIVHTGTVQHPETCIKCGLRIHIEFKEGEE